jgi:hypothetical protein
VAIRISPAEVGPNRFVVTLPGDVADGQVERVQLTLAYQASDLGNQPLLLERSGTNPNAWVAASPLLSQPGPWEAQLLVRQTGKDDLRTTVSFSVADRAEGDQTEDSMPGSMQMSGMASDASAHTMAPAPSAGDSYPLLPPPTVTVSYLAVLVVLTAVLAVCVRMAQRRFNPQ